MKDSHIQWTDNTFNGWEGCTKVSPGCLNCYAETRNIRFAGGANWGAGKPRRRTSASNWREPLRWNLAAIHAQAERNEANTLLQSGDLPELRRPRVFCASLSDWLDAEVPIEWLADLLTLIFDCGFLDWQLLTKRPENFKKRVTTASVFMRNHRPPTERQWHINKWIDDWVSGEKVPDNIWVGTSVEDQLRANVRIPLLLEIPAVVHFLSCEPLLEHVTFEENWLNNRLDATKGKVDWVIVGGESGPGCRRTSVDAIERIILECREAKVACFVKQLGAKPVVASGQDIIHDWNLRHPKGGDPAEWPERFRVMEFPEVTS